MRASARRLFNGLAASQIRQVLPSQIRQVRAIRALLCTYRTHESHFNHIHLSACWMSLGQLARQSTKREWLQDNAEVVGSLVKRTVQAARTGDISARELANIAYGAARSGRGQKMSALFVALARAA